MFKLPMKDTYTMRKVRGNIKEALFLITIGAFEEGMSVKRTVEFIDSMIDFCELIDVFDKNELRKIFVDMLRESINENSKKEH